MFKQNFINLCNLKGVSPTSVCLSIGLSNAAFSNWTDETVPRMTTLQKIANYFGVTVDYLLGKTDVPNPQSPQEPAIPEDSVIFHFNGEIGKKKLTKEQMAMIKAMLDAIPDTPLDN